MSEANENRSRLGRVWLRSGWEYGRGRRARGGCGGPIRVSEANEGYPSQPPRPRRGLPEPIATVLTATFQPPSPTERVEGLGNPRRLRRGGCHRARSVCSGPGSQRHVASSPAIDATIHHATSVAASGVISLDRNRQNCFTQASRQSSRRDDQRSVLHLRVANVPGHILARRLPTTELSFHPVPVESEPSILFPSSSRRKLTSLLPSTSSMYFSFSPVLT